MSNHNHDREKNALATRYADLLEGQADAEELQLIGDLETLYTSATVPTQLIVGAPHGMEEPERPLGSPLPYTENPPDVGDRVPIGSPKRRAVAVRDRRWLNRLNALAAVLIAAALVGSLLVVTHVARRPQQANDNTGAQQCVIPQSRTGKAWLSSLHMITLTTGWALGGDLINQSRILHTTDGGATWQDVTPPAAGKANNVSQRTAYTDEAYFLNACSAWVASGQPANTPALLFRTADGGLTWQQFALPGNEIRGIDFIDARVGWLLVDVLKNDKFSEEDIYHTIDGGQHLTKIAVSSPGTDNQPGALPFVNGTNNLTFLNATTGWATGSSMVYGPRLFITHDGGRTWHQQSLPPPGNGDTSIFKSGTVTWPPQFFSATDGILPVSFWAADGLDIYTTRDGGNSWQSTSLLHIPMPPNLDVYAPTSDPDFVDVNHGWVSGWQGTSLYATSDGGRHWTKFVPQPNMQYWALINYDFVTDQAGWAIRVFTGKSPVPVPPGLYKTEDGGRTWTSIGRG